jgi:hypothetical protein
MKNDPGNPLSTKGLIILITGLVVIFILLGLGVDYMQLNEAKVI